MSNVATPTITSATYDASTGFALDSFGKSPFALMATGRLTRVMRQAKVRRLSAIARGKEIKRLRKEFSDTRIEMWRAARAGKLHLAPLRTVYKKAARLAGLMDAEGLLTEGEEAEENRRLSEGAYTTGAEASDGGSGGGGGGQASPPPPGVGVAGLAVGGGGGGQNAQQGHAPPCPACCCKANQGWYF